MTSGEHIPSVGRSDFVRAMLSNAAGVITVQADLAIFNDSSDGECLPRGISLEFFKGEKNGYVHMIMYISFSLDS